MESDASWANLYRIEPFGHSWLPKSLRSTSSRTKAHILIWAVLGVLPVVVYTVTALLDGTFYLEGEPMGLIEERLGWVTLASVPLLFSAMAIVFPKLPEVLFTLKNVIAQAPSAGPTVPETRQPSANYTRRSYGGQPNSSLATIDDGPKLSPEKFNEILKRHEETILGKNNSKYLAIALFVGYMIVVGMGAYNNWSALEVYGYDTWASKNHMAGFVVVAIYLAIIMGALLSFLTFKFITVIHVMRSICVELTGSEVIRVRPTNPDKAGGLGAIGKFSLQMVLVLVAPVAPIVTAVFLGFATNLVFMISVSFYVPLLVFSFFYPLGGAHRAMSNAKREALDTLSQQANRIYDDFMIDMKSNKPSTLKADFELADNVDKLYVKAQQMPVWPFNLATLGRFGGVLLTVTLTVWLKFIIGWFSGIG